MRYGDTEVCTLRVDSLGAAPADEGEISAGQAAIAPAIRPNLGFQGRNVGPGVLASRLRSPSREHSYLKVPRYRTLQVGTLPYLGTHVGISSTNKSPVSLPDSLLGPSITNLEQLVPVWPTVDASSRGLASNSCAPRIISPCAVVVVCLPCPRSAGRSR